MTFHRQFINAAACLALLGLPAAAQDAGSEIRARIQSLQQSLQNKAPEGAEFESAKSYTEDLLKGATEALNAGRLYLCLEKLAQVSDFLAGARMASEKADAAQSGMAGFEAEWGKASVTLTALDKDLRAKNWKDRPAAIRAMSEAALVKSTPLMDGGRGFAISTKPKDGLFYVGEALGEAQFAVFSSSLPLSRKGHPVPVRSLLPELQALQEKTNAAFQPPRSIELHSRFIALNSTLKLAQELDSSRFYSGALYQYLEALRHYGMLDAVAPDAAGQSELKPALARLHQQLQASKDDDSIAEIFVERAESLVAGSPSQDEWKSARVIVEQVVPAYFTARGPASTVAQKTGKTVEITLVRWPYT